jgi:hypothetical protein
VQAIRNAFRFIKASLSLALKQIQLQEPWFALALGGLVILFVWFLPVGVVIWLIGLTPLGLSLIGLLALLALVSLLIWGEITALLTSRAFATIGLEAAEDQPTSLKFLSAHAGAVLVLALTLPLLSLGNWLHTLLAKPDAEPDEKSRWLAARTLALPVIANEGPSLQATQERLQQIVRDNLLRFREDLIKVRLVAGVIEALLIVLGIALGFVVGLKIADPTLASAWSQVLAAGVAMLVAWLPTIIGIMFSTFARSCYATALYQWVRNVAAARESGDTTKAQPPAILAQVLGMTNQPQKDA